MIFCPAAEKRFIGSVSPNSLASPDTSEMPADPSGGGNRKTAFSINHHEPLNQRLLPASRIVLRGTNPLGSTTICCLCSRLRHTPASSASRENSFKPDPHHPYFGQACISHLWSGGIDKTPLTPDRCCAKRTEQGTTRRLSRGSSRILILPTSGRLDWFVGCFRSQDFCLRSFDIFFIGRLPGMFMRLLNRHFLDIRLAGFRQPSSAANI